MLYLLNLTYLLIYLLTLCSTVLLEKLTGPQTVKKFSAFYGTRRFITTFTSARHLSLSWASSIQSIPPHPTSWRSNLILSPHLCLGLPRSKMLYTLCKIQSATLCVMTLCDLIRYRCFGGNWCLHLRNRWQGITFHNTSVYIHWWRSQLSSVVLIPPIEFFSQECAALRQGRIKLFGAPRQWKHFRPLFQAVFLSQTPRLPVPRQK